MPHGNAFKKKKKKLNSLHLWGHNYKVVTHLNIPSDTIRCLYLNWSLKLHVQARIS